MFFMMWVVYKVFGNSLSPKSERVGLIMELPPYHKPNFKNILYATPNTIFPIPIISTFHIYIINMNKGNRYCIPLIKISEGKP